MSKRANGEGSIRQRSDGRWEAIVDIGFVDGRRKRKSVYGKTQREVVTKANEVKLQVQKGLPVPDEKLTVARFLEQWLNESVKPSVRASTFQSYESYVRNHLAPGIGKRPLAKLTALDVQRCLNAISAEHSPRTVQYVRAILRRALGQALRWRMVSQNVATQVDIKRVPRPEYRWFSDEEAQTFLKAINGHRLESLFVLTLMTGLRSGEVRGLKWADLDLTVGKIAVRRTIARVAGSVLESEPKTDRSRRTLPVSPKVVSLLREHRNAQRGARLRAGSRWRESDFAFTTAFGAPLDASNLLHEFHKVLEGCGLPRIRFHDLRHSCASFMLAGNTNLRVVMEQLGHSQIGITANTYSHVVESSLKEASARMEERLMA